MKNYKKVIAFILCIAMVLGSCTSAFALQGNTINYVSLGASQTNGYGLPGYVPAKFIAWTGSDEDYAQWNEKMWQASVWNPEYKFYASMANCGFTASGYEAVVEGAYPVLIKNKLTAAGNKVNFDQLALCSMRVDELRVLLDDDYYGDEYTEWRFTGSNNFFEMISGKTGDEALEYVRNDYRTKLKNADLITYDLGSNNFGVYLANNLTEEPHTVDYSKILSEEEYEVYITFKSTLKKNISDLFEKAGISKANDIAEYIEYYADVCAYALVGYCSNFDYTIGWIYENNPDVELIVLQIQNFASGMTLDVKGVSVGIGDIINIPIAIANAYASSLSKYSEKYIYTFLSDGERVRFNIDDLRDYDGKISDAFKQAFDILDNNIYLKNRVAAAYKGIGGTVGDATFNKIMNAEYDALLTVMQHADAEYTLNIDALTKGTSKYKKILLDGLLTDVFTAVAGGQDYDDAVDKAIASLDALSDADKGAFLSFIWFSFGNSYFSHPDAVGNEDMCNKILTAYTLKLDGKVTKAIGLLKAGKELRESGQSITTSLSEAALKLANDFGYDEEEVKALAKETVTTIAAAVKESSDSITENVKDTVKQVKDNSSKAAADLKNAVDKVSKAAVDVNTGAETSQSSIKEAKDAVDEAKESIEDAAKNNAETIKESADTNTENTKGAFNKISAAITNVYQTVSAKIGSFVNTIKNLFK